MREHEVNTRIIRIFNTYGLRMRPSDGTVLPNFIIQALTGKPLTIYKDRSQTKSFCYADDLLDGCCRMLTTSVFSLDSCSARTINLGGNEEISIYHSHIE
jgi:nucleoside-diphosphate-sugar epimerase